MRRLSTMLYRFLSLMTVLIALPLAIGCTATDTSLVNLNQPMEMPSTANFQKKRVPVISDNTILNCQQVDQELTRYLTLDPKTIDYEVIIEASRLKKSA